MWCVGVTFYCQIIQLHSIYTQVAKLVVVCLSVWFLFSFVFLNSVEGNKMTYNFFLKHLKKNNNNNNNTKYINKQSSY